MSPEKRNEKLQAIDDALARWHRRQVRAVNAITKLLAQRKRLTKPLPLNKLDPPIAFNDSLEI
jgi:hypothetical protein